jgi:hypothetical protein
MIWEILALQVLSSPKRQKWTPMPPHPRVRDRRAAFMAEQLQRQVRQSPRDLLVRPLESEGPPVIGSGRRGVEAWQDEHGELFFKDASVASRVYVPTPYGLDPRVPKKRSRVDDLKRALIQFLWGLTEHEDWGVRELFRQIRATSSCQEADTGLICIAFDSFIEFIDQYGSHINRARASRQEWFAVLRSMQELSIASASGITFGALRTAMLDPFHRVGCLLADKQYPRCCLLLIGCCFCLVVLGTLYALHSADWSIRRLNSRHPAPKRYTDTAKSRCRCRIGPLVRVSR